MFIGDFHNLEPLLFTLPAIRRFSRSAYSVQKLCNNLTHGQSAVHLTIVRSATDCQTRLPWQP